MVDKVVEGAAVCIVGVVVVFIIGKEVNVRCKMSSTEQRVNTLHPTRKQTVCKVSD